MKLSRKFIVLDDAKLFVQFHPLVNFADSQDKGFDELMVHDKWILFFKSCEDRDFYSELRNVAQFFFCIMAHNANVERVFL